MNLTKLRYQFFFNSYHKKVITYLSEDKVQELEQYLAKIQILFGHKKTIQLLCYENNSNIFPLGCAQSTRAIDILRAYGADLCQAGATIDIHMARPELAAHILRLIFKDGAQYMPHTSDIIDKYVRDAYFELTQYWLNTPSLADKEDIILLFLGQAISSSSPNLFAFALESFSEYISVLKKNNPKDEKIAETMTCWSTLLFQSLFFYNLDFAHVIIDKINEVYLLEHFCKALKDNEPYIPHIRHYLQPAFTKFELLQRVDKEKQLMTEALLFELPTTEKKQFIHKI